MSAWGENCSLLYALYSWQICGLQTARKEAHGGATPRHGHSACCSSKLSLKVKANTGREAGMIYCISLRQSCFWYCLLLILDCHFIHKALFIAVVNIIILEKMPERLKWWCTCKAVHILWKAISDVL